MLGDFCQVSRERNCVQILCVEGGEARVFILTNNLHEFLEKEFCVLTPTQKLVLALSADSHMS